MKTYGPVSVEDIVWWTGWTKREVREHLRSLIQEVEEIQVEGLDGTYLVHSKRWEEGRVPQSPPCPCSYLLPGGDSLLKGYDGFSRFLAKRTHNHNVLRFMPAVMVDGLGLGNWAYRITPDKTEVIVEAFESAEGEVQESIREASSRIGQFVSQGTAPVEVRMQVRTGPWNSRSKFPNPLGNAL